MEYKIKQWVYDCAVKDVKTVKEFAQKYRKHDRFLGRGEKYAEIIMDTHHEEFKEDGYTIISRHDSCTGKAVSFMLENDTNN